MKTVIAKISKKDFPPLWRQFLSAGTEWVDAYETLRNCRRENPLSTLANWYVPPFAVSMSIECMAKSLASVQDENFNPFSYGHETNRIIKDYSNKIPIFKSISENKMTMALIQEYEKALDTKFGGTFVHLDGDDAESLLDTAMEIRAEVLRITGVSF